MGTTSGTSALSRRAFLVGAASAATAALLAACGGSNTASTATPAATGAVSATGAQSTAAPTPGAASAATGSATTAAGSAPAAVTTSGQKVSGSVSMWVYPLLGDDQTKNESLWSGIVKDFTTQNPGVKVDVQVLPWTNRDDKLTTALAGNKGPDVCYINEDQIAQHVEAGTMTPLDDYITAEERSDYLQNALTSATYKGKLYTAPILLTSTTIVYNTKLFKDAGVDTYPTTWDELLQVAPKFKEKGLFATSYSGALDQSLNLSYYPHLWQADGNVLNDDGTAAFNSAQGLEALTFVTKLFSEGFTDKNEAITRPAQGQSGLDLSKAATGLTIDNSGAQLLAKEWGPGILKIGAPLKNKKQISYGTVAGFGLFSSQKSKDASVAWIRYLTSPAVAKGIIQPGSYFPTKKSIGALYGGDPVLSEFEKILPMMRGGQLHPKARQVISTLAPEIQAAFLGKKSSQQALSDGEKAVNTLIKQG
jgi:multiple sugar transport system substrate-binding protein